MRGCWWLLSFTCLFLLRNSQFTFLSLRKIKIVFFCKEILNSHFWVWEKSKLPFSVKKFSIHIFESEKNQFVLRVSRVSPCLIDWQWLTVLTSWLWRARWSELPGATPKCHYRLIWSELPVCQSLFLADRLGLQVIDLDKSMCFPLTRIDLDNSPVVNLT